MDETEYRNHLHATLDRIERALADVDPDVAEASRQFGALSIQLASGARCILSAQPSVRQLWLAVAQLGEAYHFDYDAASGRWLDDKGRGIELLEFLSGYLRDSAGLTVAL